MKFINSLNRFYYSIITFFLRMFSRIHIAENVVFQKLPYLKMHRSAIISIGKNSIINSSNSGYHINLFQRCKIYADRPGSRIDIGENCRIHGTCIHAYTEISIGDNCLVAGNCQIIDGNGHPLNFENPGSRIRLRDEGKRIVIERNVWIATNCIILGGTKIGEGSIITAGSVVKGIVPRNCIYGGNPAKVIKQY